MIVYFNETFEQIDKILWWAMTQGSLTCPLWMPGDAYVCPCTSVQGRCFVQLTITKKNCKTLLSMLFSAINLDLF